ncbi:MAG TPA: glycosyltransferase [Solirubrobacteraceae bacterium]|nr:glycosyltransferase [Solirubrobacteraceae bacterium]
MRLLVTVPWAETLGGAEAMLDAILHGSREEGHEVEPVFFEHGSWPERLRGEGFHVEVIEAGRLREAHRWVATVRRLAAIMRERRPDLIMDWAAKTHLYGAPAAVLAGMTDRVLWWQQAIPPRNGWLDRVATRLPARAIFCYSRAAADAQSLLRPARAIHIVNAGAPEPEPAHGPGPLQLPADVPIVGLVGRLQPWKGQDRLLRAQALLRDRGIPMHLVIVGGDAWGLSSEYAAALPALVSELGLDGAVTMTGQVPDAGPYVEQFDVLVNASDPEPFGIVLLEGMSRGVAVLGVDSGGPSEFLQSGRTGILARSGAPADLADGLQQLLVSPDRRAEIARAGLESYRRDFTDAAMRKRFFASLQQVLDAKGAPAAVRNGASPA